VAKRRSPGLKQDGVPIGTDAANDLLIGSSNPPFGTGAFIGVQPGMDVHNLNFYNYQLDRKQRA